MRRSDIAMLSLTELRRAVHVLEIRFTGATLHQIVQPDDFSLVLVFIRPAEKLKTRAADHVLLSCRPDFARISLLEDAVATQRLPRLFAQYLRAHLGRARLGATRVIGDDRQAGIGIITQGDGFEILLSILGSRSNIYLLSRAGKLLYSMRPLEETRRELAIGDPWTNPISSLRTAGVDRWQDVSDDNYLEAIERTYRQLEQERECDQLTRRVLRAFAGQSDFLERKRANLDSDLGAPTDAAHYKRLGELLKGVVQNVEPGAGAVQALDYATGEQITIALDPTLSGTGNLESYFSRYRKEERRKRELKRQLEMVRREQGELAELHAELDSVISKGFDLQMLRAFASRNRVKILLARHSPLPKSRTAAPPKGAQGFPGRLQPKRYRTADGFEIWVGRNDEGNDHLTMRLARGNDLFFHLEGSPGSHVILRTEGRKDPPSESLLDACELAVHFSRHRESNRADVHVAAVKDVKKRAGAKPGLVYVLRSKTVHLRRDPKRLERVLGSRLEE
jgi:predicted ribosome quality control (RQC) complex YloA/Tae2 family protein